MFASALGVTDANAAWLRDRVLEAASHEAGLVAKTKYVYSTKRALVGMSFLGYMALPEEIAR